MNIFYLDSDIELCAQYHTDKHVVKMILEYAQLLSTAHRVLDGKETIELSSSGRKQKVYKLSDWRDKELYKTTHINHPSAKWVRHSIYNYDFLFRLWANLLNEYTYRYGKAHKSSRLFDLLLYVPFSINKTNKFSPPWRAMPDEYKLDKSIPNYTVESYRAYYIGKKSHMFKWKNRNTPDWVK